ncbi:MAG: hypothetical protein HN472_00550 [Nitrospina sp.]|jgi:hypothetical protein|nr:hypothetical protein [Nitrospina sp.]MBT3508015.1 hypothetical protein [Nitrospina sp.]MBT3876542.1 hypothetical protein [Nitrospina sp.]MBT4049561.1 hypothetical protein [Nitrospina sp.]MBT4558273.1 hypothetical protein [Nitrospina sp.]
MKMLISLGLFFVPVLFSGAWGVQSAWGEDLKVTLEHEVAGITPEMKILPYEKGTLLANSGSQSYPKTDSKAKTSYYSSDRKSVREKKYANAGYITPGLDPVGKVAKLFEQKLGSSGPDEVYVDIGKRQGIEKGDRFTVYTLDRYIYHPVLPGRKYERLEEFTQAEFGRRIGHSSREFADQPPGKPIGHRVLIHGVLEITEAGEKYSSARAVKSYESIEIGNLLMPYQKFEDQTSLSSETNKSIEGFIIATKRDKIAIGHDHIIYIDKGWEDEVRPGDKFEVYTVPTIDENTWYQIFEKSNEPIFPSLEKRDKTPLLPFVLGEIKVIATQKKTATAIVVKSNIEMGIGNPIRFKPSHHPG